MINTIQAFEMLKIAWVGDIIIAEITNCDHEPIQTIKVENIQERTAHLHRTGRQTGAPRRRDGSSKYLGYVTSENRPEYAG